MKNLFFLSIIWTFLFAGCSNELGNSDLDSNVPPRSVCDGGANDPEAWVGSSTCNGSLCCFEIISTYANQRVEYHWTWDGPNINPSKDAAITSSSSPYKVIVCLDCEDVDESHGISLHTEYGCEEFDFPCVPACS